ncbi:MAG TPA: DUF92 domain-containing protein [Thermoanaerobaculia bacterium]|nr:DUF92 domain-containing protein [Thermoanaerobaculia bacterium]
MTASDWKRKAVHAGMGLFALTLRWLDWKVAALLALAALLVNLFVMPRIGRGIYRDASRLRDTGIVSYAAMVLVLITLFRGYLPVAAVVWAMMAFGDPAASIAGKLLGGPRLPWNREKTWIGFASNWAVGGGAAVLFFWWVATWLTPPAVAILIIGSCLYAFLESVRAGIDDNIVAAIPTALAMVQLGYLKPEFGFWAGGVLRKVLLFLLVNAVLAFLTWRVGLVQGSGALGGAIAGFLIAVSGGWAAYAILWGFFLLGTAATKWGYRSKAALGVAQTGEGRRGVAHVMANCAVPVALLILGAWPIAFVAAFAAALADTLGTEFGGLYGRRAFSPLGWNAVPVGTRGAISWSGTLAGLLGAAALGVIAALVGWMPWSLLAVVVAAGLLGSLTESALNDLGRRRGFWLDHDFANALNTFVGAMIALEIAFSLDSGYLYVPVGGV